MVDKNISLKFEIKNKKLFIQYAVIGACMVSIAAIFVWQIQNAVALKRVLEQKKTELKKVKATSKHLKKLETQALDLEEKEGAINKKAPRGETKPFGLIKALTAFAEEIGLHNTAFTMKEAAQPADTGSIPPEAPAASEDGMTSQETMPVAIQNESGGAPPLSDLIPINFEMRFAGTFLQLLKLLEKLYALERIITVERIEVERKTALIPFQKISLLLTTYSFPRVSKIERPHRRKECLEIPILKSSLRGSEANKAILKKGLLPPPLGARNDANLDSSDSFPKE